MKKKDSEYNAQVENLTLISESFPDIPDRLIERDFILNTIKDYLDEGNTVILEGPEGYGKTTLLSQFVTQNPKRSVNVFITRNRSWYQPEAVKRDICNQIHWILNNEELQSKPSYPSDVDPFSLLPILVRKLNKQGRRGSPYYFVVDGITEIPEKAQHAQKEILEAVPFEAAGIRVILTGSKSVLPEGIQSKIHPQSVAMMKFGRKDTVDYLSDLVEDTEVTEQIHQICRGIPGRLASVRRILKRGTSPESILYPDDAEIEDLFELEWREVESKCERHILALLAYSDVDLHKVDLARILDISQEEVASTIEKLGFIEVAPRSGRVGFVSKAFRRYAEEQLSFLENDVQDWIVDDLMDDLDSKRTLVNLPVQLHETGRHNDLVEYLSPDRFYRVLASSQSLGLANQVADLAYEAAETKSDFGAQTRFSLHKSALSGLWGVHVKRSEVGALTALGDFEGALALADTALSELERLQLLVIIARKQREQGVSIDDNLLKEIRQLSEDVEASDLSHVVEEVCADLIYVDPELALRLLERSAGAGSGEHSIDVAYLKLSISEAMRSRNSVGSEISHTDTLEEIQERIQNPEVRQLSSKMGLLLGEYSPERVIEEADSFDKTGDKLVFLQKWTQSHKQSGDAGQVIEYALKQLIQNTDYSYDADLLRKLAEPLPNLHSEDHIRQLVRIFDQQKQIDNVFIEELIRLEVILARAEERFNSDAAENRLGKLYFNIEEISDLAAKTEGLARLVSAIPLGEEVSKFESEVLEISTEDLESSVDALLASSADQIDATRQVIRGLAKNRPERALSLALRLNTEQRRDSGVLAFLDSALNAPISEIEISNISQALGQIESHTAYDKALTKIFDRLVKEREELEKGVKFVERIHENIARVSDASDRFNVSVQAYEILIRADKESSYSNLELASKCLRWARKDFNKLDHSSSKISLAFQTVSRLAEVDREIALEFKERAEEVRTGVTFESGSSRSAYLSNLDLALRAYRGLLPTQVDVTEDREKIFSLLEKLSSLEDKIRFLSELAFSFFQSDRAADGRDIVEENLRPLLGRLPESDRALHHDMWAFAAPPLYFAADRLTLSDLEELPRKYKDKALANIATAITRGVMPSEPFEGKPTNRSLLQPNEIHKLLAVMRRMESDSHIYITLERIVNIILDDDRKRTYDRSFRVDIHSRIKEIAEDSLPNTKFIDHKGYLILARTDLLRLKDTFSDVGTQDWIDLIDEARSLDNEADRALVISKLAEKYPVQSNADRERRIKLLDEVEELIENLPTAKDRLNRLESLAHVAKKIDESRARRYYREAFSILHSAGDDIESSTLSQIRKRIVSSAHRMDPDFASSLASLIDDDPAHEHELRRNIRNLERRKRISSGTENGNDTRNHDPDFPQVCWRSLGALNAGRLTPLKKDRAQEVVEKARHYPIRNSYPVQSFAVEGIVKMYKDKDQANQILRPVFEAALQNAHLVERMAVRSSKKQLKAKEQSGIRENENYINVSPGDRGEAIDEIKKWLFDNLEDRIVICDQYFGPDDIEAIYIIQAVSPNCQIEILSSEHHHRKTKNMDIENAYLSSWRERYDQEIPNLRVVVAGKQDETKRSPIHDRWWLTERGGIRLGTSFNGLGREQSSEIGFMDEDECASKLQEVERYLTTRARAHDGTKISYKVANL